MAEFNGGDVVVVPMPATLGAVSVPVAPDMVVWALPGPAGEIPYAEVEALVDAEFDDRIDTMTQLEANTQTAASTASTAAAAAAGSASDAEDIRSDIRWVRDNDVYPARDAAATSAGTATTQAGIATTAAGTATEAAEIAEQYALEFDLDVTSTTGAPGSQASATVAGDGPAYQINIVVPQGAKGPKGDTGEISQAQLDAAVASLVDNAPEALDTLTELAAALGNDPNFATTVSTEIGKRVLIDGAPAAYNTLGKLVTALQNHELGGSTDASVLEGALSGQVDASAAMVPDPSTEFATQYPLGTFVEQMVEGLNNLVAFLSGKSDVGHTHSGSDITGALTDDVNVTNAMVQYSGASGALGASLSLLFNLIESKPDVGHTHTWSQISNAPAYSKDATGDNLVQRSANGHINVPAGAGPQNAPRRSEVDAALAGKVTVSGATTTLWSGSQSAYDALPEATRNAIGFVAVII